ncbi:unnamed protein product [Parnassius mnemosyne]|uniref:Uncharacterized protein n=1 Tax=Parnassius mnemosyne TaxID=213953 RepID=A0AAV1KET0_9NEOP
MCVREIWRQELIRTIPQSTPRGRCDRKCKKMQHAYAAPVNQADQKKLVDYSNCSALNAVKWKDLALGCPCPEMRTVFHVRPDLRSAEHAKLYRGQFGLPFQVNTKLHTIRYVDAEDSDAS